MNIETVREYCLNKKFCEESFPFDDDVLVFKVLGKMFACMFLHEPDKLILKCNADFAIELRENYDAIEPAFHFNKKYWNQHWISRLSDDFVKSLIDHSYNEVLRKFSKKKLAEYNLHVTD
jgi:predicted DNA-binding protein (MmcQ/YjbR family)